MTVTSSTTAVAFFANAFSPIMPIQAFGLFTGVLIPINFLLVVMIMPPAVIYFEKNIEKQYTLCCGCCKPNCCKKKNNDVSEAVSEFQDADILDDKAETGKVEEFFDKTWNKYVKLLRIPIVVLSIIWAGVTFYYAP